MTANSRAGPLRSGEKGLIITADDFGAALEVNEAVERGFREGVLTAASLMVAAPAAGDAVERARRLPGLGVGLHLVLIDGRPALPARDAPHLVGPDGRFRSNMTRSGLAFALSGAARRELAREVEAQFKAFAATGLRLDHVNAHKHFHLHPVIAGLIERIGADFGLAAIRLPVEPGRILRAVEPGSALRSGAVEAVWARRARTRLRRAGLLAPDQVFGLAWSGAMVEHRLVGLLARLPPGLSEIYLHPATRGEFAGAAGGYRYEAELAGLLSPAVRDAAEGSGARRGRFCDFTDQGR